MKKIFSFLLIILVLIAGCEYQNLEENIFTGQHKQDVREKLGEPGKVNILTKNSEHFFGPVTNLWYQIDTGEKIIIWIYKTWIGRKEIYFLND